MGGGGRGFGLCAAGGPSSLLQAGFRCMTGAADLLSLKSNSVSR